jgi:hypothetical protein
MGVMLQVIFEEMKALLGMCVAFMSFEISVGQNESRMAKMKINLKNHRQPKKVWICLFYHREEIVQRGNTRQIVSRRYIQSINYRKLY